MVYMKRGRGRRFKAIANELKELTEQIDKIGKDTTFNGIYLLRGDLEGKTEETTGGIRSKNRIKTSYRFK